MYPSVEMGAGGSFYVSGNLIYSRHQKFGNTRLPSPRDFPNFGSNIVRLKPTTEPMLPFVMLPRPLQESNVVGKAGTAGFLGKAYDPYAPYPPGGYMDMKKMDKITILIRSSSTT
jgi:hypothetical protein